jgi:UDP-glucose 4-epimerase
VYGDRDPKTLPVHENDALHPKSPYGEQKRIGEQYGAMYARQYDLATLSLRPFNVYGPRFDPKGAYALVIGKFITQRLAGEPLTVTGDGTQTRDFTHVSDVVRAFVLAMHAGKVGHNNPGRGEAYNIGAGNPATINWIAATVGGKGYPITHIEARDEPKATYAYNLKAARYLDWRPEVRLEDGINELKRACGLE